MANVQKTTHPVNISVVIVTYRRPGRAKALAETIRNQEKDTEIIIVDQENTSGIKASPYETGRTRYFNCPHANISAARNAGWREASGDIVLFLDDDVEITKETMGAHSGAYKNNDIVAVAGRVINDGEDLPENTQVMTDKTNMLATRFVQRFWSTKRQIVDFPYGCNMSIRKKILAEIGGFDEAYNRIFDDIDIGQRLKKNGHILFEPQALVYHHKAQSGGTRTSLRSIRLMVYKNYGYYMAKHVLFPFSLITLLLRIRTARYEAPFAIKDLFNGYISYVKTHRGTQLAFLFITLIATVRLMHVPALFYFGIDEEYQSFLGWSIVKDFHLIWVGLSAGSTGFYVGSGLVYLHSLLLWLSHGDPVSLAYAASIIGVITTVCLYRITQQLFNDKTALIATLLYGFSAFMNMYDRRFWNPTLTPLISIAMLYAYVKVQRNPWWWVAIAFLLGMSLHIHASLFVYFIITAIILIQYLRSKRTIPIKIILASSAVFAVWYAPLFVFDLAKHFENLKTPLRLLKQGGGSGNMIVEHATLLMTTLTTSLFTSPSVSAMFFFIFILVLLLKKNNQRYPVLKMLYLSLGIFSLSFILFPGKILDYYALGIIPLGMLVVAIQLTKLPKYILIPLLALYLIVNLSRISTMDASNGLTAKKLFVQKVSSELQEKPFYLDTAEPYLYNGGWRYLFKMYGQEPVASRADDMFGWIYARELKNEQPTYRVIIGAPTNTTDMPIHTIQSGSFRAIMYEE